VVYDRIVPETWRKKFNWDSLNDETKELLGEYGYFMYNLNVYEVSEIDEIKYEGRLIILDNGKRFEVDSVDANTSEYWNIGDKVIVIDDEIYNIEDCEKVDVEEDI
jgi:hypothetical protein